MHEFFASRTLQGEYKFISKGLHVSQPPDVKLGLEVIIVGSFIYMIFLYVNCAIA
jgi:hypothetical protein